MEPGERMREVADIEIKLHHQPRDRQSPIAPAVERKISALRLNSLPAASESGSISPTGS